MTKYIIGEFFSSSTATLYKNTSDQTVNYEFIALMLCLYTTNNTNTYLHRMVPPSPPPQSSWSIAVRITYLSSYSTVLCYHIGIGLSSPISIKLRARACVCPHITSVKLDTFNLADHYPHYHSNGHTPPAVPTVDTGQNGDSTSYLYPNLRPMLHMGKVSPEG